MKFSAPGLAALATLGTLLPLTAHACPIGKLCGQTLVMTVKQTDASGNSSENPQRMFISPKGEVQAVETMGNQQIRINCSRTGATAMNTCPGPSCIESTANGILDMAERRTLCRYAWDAAGQTLTMQNVTDLRLVRRSLGTPGVARENFPKHDGVAVLAQVQTFNTQGVNTIRFSGNSCSLSGQSRGNGSVRMMNEFAQPVTSNSASTTASIQSTSCEVRRGRHLEN